MRIGILLRSRLLRWSARTACLAGILSSSLMAADIAVSTTNDSGAGSFRQGLSVANSGDRLVFDSLTSPSTLTNGAALNFTQPVTLLATSSLALTDAHAFTLAQPVTVDWAGTLNLNGILSDGGSTGSLIKTGVGTLALSGTNTYSGGTTLDGGALNISNSSALGSGALAVHNLVGSLALDLANGVQLNNNISLFSGLVINTGAGATSKLGGIISESGGSYGLDTTGTGTLILSGANTFSGGVYVGNDSTIRAENNAALGTGKLTVSGALTLDLASGVNLGNHIYLGNNFTTNVDSGVATLSGTIDEAAPSHLTKTGAGTLVLGGFNSYTGGTTVSQGTLQGDTNSLYGNILNNGTVVFNQTWNDHYDGNITGSGDLTKTGSGTLIFNGTDSYAGTTTINMGELQVRGSLTSDVQISSFLATLSGSGSVGSVTNDGYVSPGNSGIGNLTVNGDFTQQPGGKTEIEINTAGNTPGVNNDHLSVSGQANLGGTLDVLAVGGGTFNTTTHYTILNATGGVFGQYAQVNDNLSMFGVAVTYDANDVTIQLQQTSSLHQIAATSNQFAVGSALDSIALSSSGGLFSMINTLGAETAAQQRTSLNQLSGELFGNTQTIGLQVGDQFQQRITSRLINNGKFLAGQPDDTSSSNTESSNTDVRGQSPSQSTNGWVQGYGVGGNLRSDGSGAGVSYSQGGAVYGMDWGADETGVIGIAGGNSYVGYHDGFSAGGTLTSYQVGLYALKQNDAAYVLGSTNYGYDTFGSNRNVDVGGFNQTLRGNYAGHQLGAYAESGLKLHARWVHLQPLVGLQYLYLAQQGFDESGGSAALDVSASQANSLRANLGGRIVVDQLVGPMGALWTPYWQGRWVSELLDNDRIVNASFSGAPIGGAFTTHGTRLGQNYFILSKGLQVQLNNQWSLYANLDLMTGGRITTETGSGGVTYAW